MGATVEAYKRLPEHTTVPDMAWEIDALVEEYADLQGKLLNVQNAIWEKQNAYFAYLRQHWTHEEIIAAQKGTKCKE